jgi:long-chain fatty acid transport protein
MNRSATPIAAALAMWSGAGAVPARETRAQGIVATGAGSVVRSFGGTAIAAPLTGLGALFWNPATLSFMDRRVDAGLEALWRSQHLESTIPAGLLGPGVPPAAVTGKTKSADGTLLGPSTAVVFRSDDKRWRNLTFGFGIFPYSDGGSDYPADPSNPTLASLGGWINDFVVYEIPVAASYKVNDRGSIGLAIDIASVSWEWSRAVFAPPETDTIDGRVVSQFPSAFVVAPKYGAGAHLGLYHHFAFGVGLGAMAKTSIFFGTIHYNATTLLGQRRTVSVNLNSPPFFGAGVSYGGRKNWLFALDLKYAFYEHRTGFFGEPAAFEPDGSVKGLGYRNGLAVTTGVQYKANERLTARLGYAYNTRVVPDQPTFEITAGSLRNAISGGVSYDATKAIAVQAAFVHAWAIPIRGEMTAPQNAPIPGSGIRLTLLQYAPSIGVGFKY